MKTFPTLIRILLFFFLTASSCFGAEQVQFRILHLNDFHGFAEPQRLSGSAQTAGGLSFLAGSINQFRKHQPTLLLAAGDFIQGHPWTNLFEGKSTIEAMNVMGFSAMVLGNHEFDFGQDVLKKRIAEAAFPVLAANVRGFPSVKPYVIKDISGLKVGIIGLITEETSTTTHPKNVEGLIFSPVIDTAQQLVRELRNKTDLIIILSHLGLPADVALAGAVEGIDIIVGGHSHTRVEKPMIVRNTLIVQAWEHGKVLGVLDVTVRNKKISGHEGRLIVIDPVQNKPDPPVAQIVDRYQTQAAGILNHVIGEARVDLPGKESRCRETSLGNLVADILRQQTGADIALINGGGIRADIWKGPVRMNDILSVLPFSNRAIVLKVSGQEIKDIFEHGISDPEGKAGRYPQVSGMQLTYNPANPAGKRITGFTINGKPLQTDQRYTLATSDFLAAGGDGYAAFTRILKTMNDGGQNTASENRALFFASGQDIRDMVIDFIRDNKMISAAVENRIRKED